MTRSDIIIDRFKRLNTKDDSYEANALREEFYTMAKQTFHACASRHSDIFSFPKNPVDWTGIISNAKG